MKETPRRLTSEEIWTTVLAVFGGLAVLVPLVVIALNRPAGAVGEERPVGVGAAGEAGVVELREELREAQNRVVALSGELESVKIKVEASERSAQRAWVQLREVAGEPGGGEPAEGAGERQETGVPEGGEPEPSLGKEG